MVVCAVVRVRVRWWVGMVVRFVCKIRVPVCAHESRVCPGSPRATVLFNRKDSACFEKDSPHRTSPELRG
jgi:hypothetical protein